MQKQVLCDLFDHYQNKDYSDENQTKALQLAMEILRISIHVRREGLLVLEELRSGYPMLDRGLRMVLQGVEPGIVESVLFNIMLTNQIDLLTGLLIMQGVKDIQNGENPEITKDVLKSYFTLDFEDKFEQECEKSGVNADRSRLLSRQEISQLLKEQNDLECKIGEANAARSGMLSQEEILQLLKTHPASER